MRDKERNGISWFQSEMLLEAGFPVHGFTKRKGGVSQGPFASLNLSYDVGDDPACVDENLWRLREAIGAEGPLFRVKQVHGIAIAEAESLPGESAWKGEPTVEADGIVGTDAHGVLAVQNADCVPVLLADPSTRMVAAIHAGWRGASRGVVRAGVRALVDKGAKASELIAAVGPCVCESCYEVGAEVARHFPESVAEKKGTKDKFHLDLAYAVEVSLVTSGLYGTRIERIRACSSCLAEDLYSRRRDGAVTGRFLGFISGGLAD